MTCDVCVQGLGTLRLHFGSESLGGGLRQDLAGLHLAAIMKLARAHSLQSGLSALKVLATRPHDDMVSESGAQSQQHP